jgi:cellulose synthase/poly-beta-1,6-N-acetylglucosamine synthase-like glycosyltransferase
MRAVLITATVVAAALLLSPDRRGSAGQTQPRGRPSAAAAEPQRPHSAVDIGETRQTGRTIRVPGGGNLQAALDEAQPGDRIHLEPRAVYRGPFRLPRKDGSLWIVVSPEPAAGFPEPGRRVVPDDARFMPKLVAADGPVIAAAPGAHHFRLVGLEIAPAPGVQLRTLMEFGGDRGSLGALPHHLIVDRCYIRGDPAAGARRGIALNSRQSAVINSHLSDFKEVGADSQAIAGWNGPGPFRIANNYLEAAGENVMFGGADPAIDDLVPADIDIRGNHFAKPLAWREGHPGFAGVAWTVKNLFELKNARRVAVEGNLFERNWPHAQNGFAILFTVRNQDGRAPWSVVEDVTFAGNIVRSVGSGINVLGHDDNHPSRQTQRIAIRNNLFTDVGGDWGHGRLFQLLDGTRDIVIDHNTAFNAGSALFGGDGRPHTGFVFENNITMAGEGGILGSGTAAGVPALQRYFPGASVRRNVLVGAAPDAYPLDNFFPAHVNEVGIRQPPPGAGFLRLAQRYTGAGTDGRDPGADIAVLTAVVQVAGWAGWPSVPNPAAVVFWLAVALLAYTFVGYPVIARLRAAFRPQPRRRAPIEPTVTIVVAAHNEGARISARIANLLALEYPRDRVQILIGSDGSTDDTVSRAGSAADNRVHVHAFTVRRGKPAVINALVREAGGEIVVFADARQQFDAGALRALVANFADPTVGAASGELILAGDERASGAAAGTAFYWRYEKLIRSTESRGRSTVGATGAIYAIRRSLFEPLPEDTVLDDVLIPIRIARRGYRVVFEAGARAYDGLPATAAEELIRKTRTIGGTFQLLSRERWLLSPRQNPLWFETISHKVLRLAIPLLLAAMIAANAALADAWFYQWTMAGQSLFYVAALGGLVHRGSARRPVVLAVPYTMCLLSWATLAGFARFLAGRQPVTWNRAPAPTTRF